MIILLPRFSENILENHKLVEGKAVVEIAVTIVDTTMVVVIVCVAALTLAEIMHPLMLKKF